MVADLPPQPPAKIRLAQRAYNRTWASAAPLYAAHGAPPPPVTFERLPAGDRAEMHGDDTGQDHVYVGLHAMRRLAGPPSAARKSARQLLLHEWAHVYQDPQAFNADQLVNSGQSDALHANLEGSAELFSRLAAKRLFGYKTKWAKGDEYNPYVGQVKRTEPRSWLFYGQFGRQPPGITVNVTRAPRRVVRRRR